MSWFNPFFTAILSGLAGWLIADLRAVSKKYRETQQKSTSEADAIRDGVRCLLHSKLFDFYAEYKDAPSLPTQTWKEIDRVYEAYHASQRKSMVEEHGTYLVMIQMLGMYSNPITNEMLKQKWKSCK